MVTEANEKLLNSWDTQPKNKILLQPQPGRRSPALTWENKQKADIDIYPAFIQQMCTFSEGINCGTVMSHR